MTDRLIFVVPPGWPPPPPGLPPAGWRPSPSWPPAPRDWVFYRTLGGEAVVPPPGSWQPRRRRRGIVLIAVLFVVLVLMSGGIFLLGVAAGPTLSSDQFSRLAEPTSFAGRPLTLMPDDTGWGWSEDDPEADIRSCVQSADFDSANIEQVLSDSDRRIVFKRFATPVQVFLSNVLWQKCERDARAAGIDEPSSVNGYTAGVGWQAYSDQVYFSYGNLQILVDDVHTSLDRERYRLAIKSAVNAVR